MRNEVLENRFSETSTELVDNPTLQELPVRRGDGIAFSGLIVRCWFRWTFHLNDSMFID